MAHSNNEFWRYIHNPSWMKHTNLGKGDPHGNRIVNAWPDLLIYPGNPVSGVIPTKPATGCSGNLSCFAEWFKGRIIRAGEINIGPIKESQQIVGQIKEPVLKAPVNVGIGPNMPNGAPTPILAGELTTGCAACQPGSSVYTTIGQQVPTPGRRLPLLSRL